MKTGVCWQRQRDLRQDLQGQAGFLSAVSRPCVSRWKASGAWAAERGVSALFLWPWAACQGALISHFGQSSKQGSLGPQFCSGLAPDCSRAGICVPRTSLPCVWNEEFCVPIHSFHWWLSTCQGALDSLLAPPTAMNEVAWLLSPSQHRVSSRTGTKGKDREHLEEVLKMGMHRTSGPMGWSTSWPRMHWSAEALWRRGQHSHLKDQMHSASLMTAVPGLARKRHLWMLVSKNDVI